MPRSRSASGRRSLPAVRKLALFAATLALLVPVLRSAAAVVSGEPVTWQLGLSTLALGSLLATLALHRERSARGGGETGGDPAG